MRRRIVVLCLGLWGLGSFLVASPTNVSAQETSGVLGVVSYGFDPGTVLICDTTQMTSLTLELEQPPGALSDLTVAFHNPSPILGSENRANGFATTVTASDGQTEFNVPLLFPPDRPGSKGTRYGDWFINYIEVRDPNTGEVQRYESTSVGPSFTVLPCERESAPDQVSGDTFDIAGYEFSPSTVVVCDTPQTVLLKLNLAQPLGMSKELGIALHNIASQDEAPVRGLGGIGVTAMAASEDQTEFTIPIEIYPEVYGKKYFAEGAWSIEYLEVFDKKTWASQRYELAQPGPTFTVEPCPGATDHIEVAGATNQTVGARAPDQTEAAAQSVVPTPTPIPTPAPKPGSGLAHTGSNDNMLVIIGIGLILNGLVLIELTRRKASR